MDKKKSLLITLSCISSVKVTKRKWLTFIVNSYPFWFVKINLKSKNYFQKVLN